MSRVGEVEVVASDDRGRAGGQAAWRGHPRARRRRGRRPAPGAGLRVPFQGLAAAPAVASVHHRPAEVGEWVAHAVPRAVGGDEGVLHDLLGHRAIGTDEHRQAHQVHEGRPVQVEQRRFPRCGRCAGGRRHRSHRCRDARGRRLVPGCGSSGASELCACMARSGRDHVGRSRHGRPRVRHPGAGLRGAGADPRRRRACRCRPDSVAYRLKRKLLGPPLHTDELEHERLGKPTALAVFASDNLSSSAPTPPRRSSTSSIPAGRAGRVLARRADHGRDARGARRS